MRFAMLSFMNLDRVGPCADLILHSGIISLFMPAFLQVKVLVIHLRKVLKFSKVLPNCSRLE